MGRTVPSYLMAVEWEKRKWKPLREQLESERKSFDEMLSYSRLYNVAGVGACRLVLLQTILISTIFEHYKQFRKIDHIDTEINKIFPV